MSDNAAPAPPADIPPRAEKKPPVPRKERVPQKEPVPPKPKQPQKPREEKKPRRPQEPKREPVPPQGETAPKKAKAVCCMEFLLYHQPMHTSKPAIKFPQTMTPHHASSIIYFGNQYTLLISLTRASSMLD